MQGGGGEGSYTKEVKYTIKFQQKSQNTTQNIWYTTKELSKTYSSVPL